LRKRNPSSETNLQLYQEKNNTKTDKVKKKKKKKRGCLETEKKRAEVVEPTASARIEI
jgi:hypothetical protein